MRRLRLINEFGYPTSIKGHLIESTVPHVSIGELCELYDGFGNPEPVAKAQVIGFLKDRVLLNLIGNSVGLNHQCIIKPTGNLLSITLKYSFLGAVIDATGKIIERLAPEEDNILTEERIIDNSPPPYIDRKVITDPIETGIRVIDGVLTCGIGQRVGIFASAGCGKTVLMLMLIEHTDADVFVIGLIGERGREVTECADELKKSPKAGKCVLVYATSDFSSVDRCNAAQLATTIAEFYRDQGKKVVLFLDSMTRYARALRDMKLAAGEPPARRGYPASVFDSLPRLLERPGVTQKGSITAFYTVLLEGENESDPLGDEIRSILDGHIYLSRKLAGKGHYPAVDVLRSVSRVFGQITDPAHKKLASNVRVLLSTLEDLQVFIDLGEYKPGQNAENDRAMNSKQELMEWLKQDVKERSPFMSTIEGMERLA